MRIDGCDKPIAYCDAPNLFGHRHHNSFSAQPTAGRSKAGRQEAARDSVAGGRRFDGKSTVGEGRRQLAEAIGPVEWEGIQCACVGDGGGTHPAWAPGSATPGRRRRAVWLA